MYIKSPYPDVPPVPEVNVHNLLLHRPDQANWPNHTLHIDPITGRRRTFHEFLQRVNVGATALGAPISEGGLGLRGEDGEMVGIMSENSMVSTCRARTMADRDAVPGLYHSDALPSRHHDSLRLAVLVRHAFRAYPCTPLVESHTPVRPSKTVASRSTRSQGGRDILSQGICLGSPRQRLAELLRNDRGCRDS